MNELTITIDGVSVFVRGAPAVAGDVLLLHSAPTSSDDWLGLQALTGGWAPDLPGFGRSDKGGNLDYSLAAYVALAEQLLEALELAQVTVVGHGWGAAIAVALSQRRPDRVSRLVMIDAMPLLPGFRFPHVVRWLRRPLVGELVMGSLTRALLSRALRAGSARPAAWSEDQIERVWQQFDQGTQRAILRLHRSVDEAQLAAQGAGLDRLAQPALVVWGDRDPWLPAAFADAYGNKLRHAVVERVPEAGHWPWLDQPELTERVATWVTSPASET